MHMFKDNKRVGASTEQELAELTKETVSEEEVEQSIRKLLLWMGENPDREGLIDTPKRVKKALSFFSSGYEQTPEEVIGDAIFHEPNAKEMVFVGDIDIYSMCEHHILPIIGKAHIAYIPNGKVLGLSKVARVCEVYARRLQLQERLSEQIASGLHSVLEPKGVAVYLQASHMCMTMRGVQKIGSQTVTTSFFGDFDEKENLKSEFFTRIQALKLS